MTNNTDTRDVLVLKRVFNAPIERVFDAWTQPDVLVQWFGPEGYSVTRSNMQCHVGGHYDIEIRSPDGVHISHFGNYLDVCKPYRLAFTWVLADQACKGGANLNAETLVSIEFKTVTLTTSGRQATELTLTHEKLPTQASHDGHSFGWTSSLSALEHYLETTAMHQLSSK